MQEAARHIDVDNLSRFILSIVFCGTTDCYQGIAALDKTLENPKWFWINWDMEQSFCDMLPSKAKRSVLQQQPFISALPKRWKPRFDGPLRSIIFGRLMTESPAYRKYFSRLVTDVFNHRLTFSFMNKRIAHYQRLAAAYRMDLSFFKKTKDFLKHRYSIVRDDLRRKFGIDEYFACEVKGPEEIRYTIDGYPEQCGYKGHYFKGQQITIKITSAHRKAFRYWQVNRQKVSAPCLVYPVNSQTIIKPILGEKE